MNIGKLHEYDGMLYRLIFLTTGEPIGVMWNGTEFETDPYEE